MDRIRHYFPQLTSKQIEQFTQLGELYREWNQKINVISRKDIDHLYLHHILHSMAIARLIHFKEGARVLDLGTGGGLPGIPLAILFPETEFTLIDGIRKKITVVNEIAKSLGLTNVTALQQRSEERKGAEFDFIVTRAVARLEKLLPSSVHLIREEQQHGLPNGLIALKGGNIAEEISHLPKGSYTEVYPISDFFEEDFFQEKSLVYLQY